MSKWPPLRDDTSEGMKETETETEEEEEEEAGSSRHFTPAQNGKKKKK